MFYLEIYKGGTFKDLVKAHRNLIGGPRTLSSLSNKYRDIPYAFPAAVPLIGLEYISDTLISRVKYDRATVIAKKEKFLNGTDK